MRKVTILTFMSMDGIMQSPGRADEDLDGDFKFGGWLGPHFDEILGTEMSLQMRKDFDLLLGRKTYEIFASYWPLHAEEEGGKEINRARKYVVTKSDKKYTWNETILIQGAVIKEIKKLKETNGPDLQVHGSSQLIQTLLQYNLVDELWLKIVPVTLGHGKRLFTETVNPSLFSLQKCLSSPKGVILANYIRTGALKVASN